MNMSSSGLETRSKEPGSGARRIVHGFKEGIGVSSRITGSFDRCKSAARDATSSLRKSLRAEVRVKGGDAGFDMAPLLTADSI